MQHITRGEIQHMTSKERVLQRERDRGKADALALASVAHELNGTDLINNEDKIPAWNEAATYTTAHVGFPVQDGGQVFTILQPHTPAHNPGIRPVDLPAIYSIKHTKDIEKAKPYIAPNGTSGLYMTDEVCIKNGKTWCSLVDHNAWPPGEIGTEAVWKAVE